MTRLLLIVAVMTAATYATRTLPFLLFAKRKPPALLSFIARYIPPAVMTVLVAGSFRNIDFASAPHGLFELSAAAFTAALHLWKRNTLLSIAGGTILYMILIRLPA